MAKFDRVLSDDDANSIIKNTTMLLGQSISRSKDLILKVEQAVIAKLAEQEPMAWVILDSEGVPQDVEPFYHGDTLSMASKFKRPLYAHPMPNRQASLDSSLTRSGQLDRALVKSLALQSGFKTKEDGELREYVYDFAGKVLGSCKGSVDNSGHAEPFTPKTVSEMRSFIGMHFDSLQYANPETEEPDEMDRYTLTIHDLLSAFDWAGHYDCDHVVGNNEMVAAYEGDGGSSEGRVFSARDLCPELGYVKWDNFNNLILRASQMISNGLAKGSIKETGRSVTIGYGATRRIIDYQLDDQARELVGFLAGSFKLNGYYALRNETAILSLVKKWCDLRGIATHHQKEVGGFFVDLQVGESVSIEFDEPHHAEQKKEDEIKTKALQAHGNKVLRFGIDCDVIDIITELEKLTLASKMVVLDGWQPINTHPNKQLKEVLLFNKNKVQEGFLYSNEWVDKIYERINPQPTHWMPLPKPPMGYKYD